VDAVFITGSTGYLGRPLTETLLRRGYPVHALVRPGSEAKVVRGAVAVVGNALEAASFADRIPPEATFVHLVGTPHPSPAKAAEFQRVDLVSIRAAVSAASTARVRHFVYVSVAHPAPIMDAYIAVRREGEALVEASGIPGTILRPWYVLGPGHLWPYALVPVYAILRWLPSTRDAANRLGLVTRDQMLTALVESVAQPSTIGVQIKDVPAIRRAR
jgi:uncharacterized protein YbjT (DUF2867 family)